ncbi:P-type ATPase-like protein [Leptodontidium sp. MPI-SDFR-AT-0119]|nr:P-type ATPase-like protein [Leptodontidium sp. MPI-SDFR-AT-0119]
MAPCCGNTFSSGLSEQKATSAAHSCPDDPCHVEANLAHDTSGPDRETYEVGCYRSHHQGHQRVPFEACEDYPQSHHRNSRYSTSSEHAPTFTSSKSSPCSDNVCCVRKIIGHAHDGESDSTNSQSDGDKPGHNSTSTIIQIDQGITHEVERIVMGVQGMTCTGCESNLRSILESIDAISNVKTSLLLAQAEFNLRPSDSLNSTNISHAIEQMTGFLCTRVAYSGEQLELILPAGLSILEGPWPLGMTSMTSLGREKIRISYMPKVVGARTLLKDSFFRSAQFAPAPTSLAVASGRQEAYKSFILTAVSATLTIPILVLAYADLPDRRVVYGGISLVLATIVQFVAHGFYIKAYKTLRYSGMIEMDMLVVLSTTTAYLYSVIAFSFMVAGKPLSTADFFETSTLLITLILVGRTAAAYSRQKAVESISIQSLQVQTAIIVDSKNSEMEETIDCRLLQYGDKFKVLPDTRIVTDGRILEGETEVDESLITGESKLRLKQPGMSVIAGSINHSGKLVVELTRLPSENTIQAIGTMVDEAKSSKAKTQEITDRVAGYFTPAIIGMTAIVFVVWAVVGKSVRHQSTSTACINAMTYAISTLIVSCPCAIGLAVPMVLVIAGGVGARYGLIFKSASSLDIGRKITHVIFDKTGTLTQGNPSVVDSTYLANSENLPSIIMALTSNSKHPVSSGVNRYLQAQAVKPAHLEHVVSVPGKGVEATYNGAPLRGGSPQWLGVEDVPTVQTLHQRSLTIFCVDINGTLTAVFGLEDRIRPDALETINELKCRDISISLLSGDNEKVVNTIGAHLGIPSPNIRPSCTPAQKQAYVKYQLAIPNSTVLFCGDGTNDAVALAQASIGMHMNGGTDVARSAADAVLMNSSLKRIITLIDLSRAFYRRVVFNFIWSFVYNLFAILLAAGAIPRARIPPAYAGLGELVSVLPVIAIAMQLRWKKF